MPECIILGRSCNPARREEWVAKNAHAVRDPSMSTQTCFQFNCIPRNMQVIGRLQKYYSKITAQVQSGLLGGRHIVVYVVSKRLGQGKGKKKRIRGAIASVSFPRCKLQFSGSSFERKWKPFIKMCVKRSGLIELDPSPRPVFLVDHAVCANLPHVQGARIYFKAFFHR